MNKNSLATSIAARLRNVAAAEKVRYAAVLTGFLIERAVARLTKNPHLARHLIFKGGFVSLRVYQSPRYTVDLDAVLHGLSKEEAVGYAKEAMAADLGDGVWFHFDRLDELTTQQEYGGSRLVYRCGLGEKMADVRRAQMVNIDMGVGDPVTPAPRELDVPTYLASEPLSWRVYTAETTVAEKLHALFTLGSVNSRSKDLFDLDFLLPRTSTKVLGEAVAATFKHRETLSPPSLSEVLAGLDLTTLRRGWKSALKEIPEPYNFDDVVARVIEALRKHNL